MGKAPNTTYVFREPGGSSWGLGDILVNEDKSFEQVQLGSDKATHRLFVQREKADGTQDRQERWYDFANGQGRDDDHNVTLVVVARQFRSANPFTEILLSAVHSLPRSTIKAQLKAQLLLLQRLAKQ